MNDKVSIIVPVYGVEQYLDRCVKSILAQTHQNIEVILVDDESPDNCPAMCDEWAKKDSRIKVVHKKNGGLGLARNSGLEVMTGDFVTFVDSDDYIHPETCERALQKIEEYGADICIYDCANVFGGKVFQSHTVKGVSVYEGKEVVDKFLVSCIAPRVDADKNDIGIGISACMCLYKVSLFREHNLRFVSERVLLNEDLIFRIQYCKYVNKIVLIPDNLYYYYHNPGTLSSGYKSDRFEAAKKMYQGADEMLSAYGNPELHQRIMRQFMTNTIVCVKHETAFAQQNGKKTALKNIKAICKDEVMRQVLRDYPFMKMPIKQALLFLLMKCKAQLLVMALVRLELNRLKK